VNIDKKKRKVRQKKRKKKNIFFYYNPLRTHSLPFRALYTPLSNPFRDKGLILELEIAMMIVCLVGGLGFCVGSYISPVNKHLKNHIRFLEGKVNRYKQDVQEEKIGSKDGLDDIIDGNPAIKAAVGLLGGKEKAIELLLSKVDLGKILGGQKEKPSGGQVYT
tara:strand:- start:383 stop:871 length:489 start_codon:yes stop_codon:yes gene_type:complete